jgi:hypothetical protein
MNVMRALDHDGPGNTMALPGAEFARLFAHLKFRLGRLQAWGGLGARTRSSSAAGGGAVTQKTALRWICSGSLEQKRAQRDDAQPEHGDVRRQEAALAADWRRLPGRRPDRRSDALQFRRENFLLVPQGGMPDFESDTSGSLR